MGESLWGLHFLAIRGARALLLALTGVLVGLIFGAVVLLITAPAAHAEHSVVAHVSQGVTGGNGAPPSWIGVPYGPQSRTVNL